MREHAPMLTSSVGRRGASLAGLLASCFYDAAHEVEVARSSRRCLLMSRPSFLLSSHDHLEPSAARMDDRVTSTVTVLDSRCKSARQVWDVGDARGWPGQTLTTSSAMLMDC